MSDDFEIRILNEDEQDPTEPRVVSAEPKVTAKERAQQLASDAGQKAGEAAKKAWQSDTRKKVTGKLKEGATAVIAKGYELAHDAAAQAAEKQTQKTKEAVKNKLENTDWKQAGKDGASASLRWVSDKLNQTAKRFTPKEEETSSAEDEPKIIINPDKK